MPNKPLKRAPFKCLTSPLLNSTKNVKRYLNTQYTILQKSEINNLTLNPVTATIKVNLSCDCSKKEAIWINAIKQLNRKSEREEKSPKDLLCKNKISKNTISTNIEKEITKWSVFSSILTLFPNSITMPLNLFPSSFTKEKKLFKNKRNEKSNAIPKRTDKIMHFKKKVFIKKALLICSILDLSSNACAKIKINKKKLLNCVKKKTDKEDTKEVAE